jgi:hypothetical protein
MPAVIIGSTLAHLLSSRSRACLAMSSRSSCPHGNVKCQRVDVSFDTGRRTLEEGAPMPHSITVEADRFKAENLRQDSMNATRTQHALLIAQACAGRGRKGAARTPGLEMERSAPTASSAFTYAHANVRCVQRLAGLLAELRLTSARRGAAMYSRPQYGAAHATSAASSARRHPQDHGGIRRADRSWLR